MASCHTHATLCQSSHRIHRIHGSFWQRIFSHRIHRIHRSFWQRISSHRFHRCSQKLVSLRGCTCLKCTNRASDALSERESVVCFIGAAETAAPPWLAAWVWQGCHTLLICAHLCLSVGGTSLPEGSVCSACSVGTLSLFALLVLQRQLHQRGSILPRNSRNVRLRYWRRGYGRMPYPPNLCASVLSVGGTSLPECSVCSAYSVGHSLCLLCWCICGRHISAGFRSPPDQIASAARSDSVRHPVRLRPLHDAISSVCTLRRLHCNTPHVPLLHPFMFAKLRNKFDF